MRRTVGFTLLELLVVVGMLTLVSVAVFPFLGGEIGKSELTATVWEMTTVLRHAQSQSIAGRGNSGWGVHLETDTYTLFQGMTYSPGDPDNLVYDLSPGSSISNISLNGGGSDVRFDKASGRTSDYGTVTVLDDATGETLVITITQQGHIEAN